VTVIAHEFHYGWGAAGVPATPGAPTATPLVQQVSISWSAVTGATSYDLYRAGVLIATPSGTSYVDPVTDTNVSASYTVAARNGLGVSAQSAASASVAPRPTFAAFGLPL
jgi:hypothetical protein